MAGIPSQRDRLAPGAGHRRSGAGTPPPLSATVRRGQAALPAALVALLVTGAVARQAVTAAAGPVAGTYGFALLLLAAWGISRRQAGAGPADLGVTPRALVAGAAVAALLLAPGLWLRATGHPTRVDLFGGGFFLPLVPALLWVAPAEELFLRGLLQPVLRGVIGNGGAILVAGILFAAIHLPAYGWTAMPLDLGVGLLLGWLREETRSVAACATAHTLADLGSWFLA